MFVFTVKSEADDETKDDKKQIKRGLGDYASDYHWGHHFGGHHFGGDHHFGGFSEADFTGHDEDKMIEAPEHEYHEEIENDDQGHNSGFSFGSEDAVVDYKDIVHEEPISEEVGKDDGHKEVATMSEHKMPHTIIKKIEIPKPYPVHILKPYPVFVEKKVYVEKPQAYVVKIKTKTYKHGWL